MCDHVNDVAERAAQEKIKHDGLASIIKKDMYLIFGGGGWFMAPVDKPLKE